MHNNTKEFSQNKAFSCKVFSLYFIILFVFCNSFTLCLTFRSHFPSVHQETDCAMWDECCTLLLTYVCVCAKILLLLASCGKLLFLIFWDSTLSVWTVTSREITILFSLKGCIYLQVRKNAFFMNFFRKYILFSK